MIVFDFIIFCIFLILKLCGVIAWSWWWVTCPLWAIPAIILLVLIIDTIIDFINDITEKKSERNVIEEKIIQRRRDGLEALSKMSIEANRMIEKERQEREEK